MTRGRSALLVVDVQNAALAAEPYAADVVLDNIRRLVRASRSGGVEVVYIQHDGDRGGDFEPGTDGWQIHGAVAPEPHEKVVRKAFNSAFRGTDLRSHLEGRNIDTLIVVGIQTELCVDTTCRIAFEHGYKVVVPEMTNTTYDNGALTGKQIYEHHNRNIFAGRFATVCSMREALEVVSAGGDVE